MALTESSMEDEFKSTIVWGQADSTLFDWDMDSSLLMLEYDGISYNCDCNCPLENNYMFN